MWHLELPEMKAAVVVVALLTSPVQASLKVLPADPHPPEKKESKRMSLQETLRVTKHLFF